MEEKMEKGEWREKKGERGGGKRGRRRMRRRGEDHLIQRADVRFNGLALPKHFNVVAVIIITFTAE